MTPVAPATSTLTRITRFQSKPSGQPLLASVTSLPNRDSVSCRGSQDGRASPAAGGCHARTGPAVGTGKEPAVIPTLILIGAVFGRWWRVTLAVSVVGWPMLLVATGAMSVGPELAGAAGLAVLNTGAGVLIHQGILRDGRNLWRAMAARRRT